MGENLEAKEFLQQVKTIDLRIKNKLIEKQQWHDLALTITANMDGERVQSSGAKDKMASALNVCLDMEDEIFREVVNLKDEKKKVVQTIERLYSPTEYDVIHRRFIQYQTLQDIADDYGKDYGWAKVTCKRAVGHVQAILNKR